jgi:hypothetical protein
MVTKKELKPIQRIKENQKLNFKELVFKLSFLGLFFIFIVGGFKHYFLFIFQSDERRLIVVE